MQTNELILNDEFKITSDGRQFILNRKAIHGEKSKNPGEIYWTEEGYFASLQGAIGRVSKQYTMEHLGDLKLVVDKLDEIRSRLNASLGAV